MARLSPDLRSDSVFGRIRPVAQLAEHRAVVESHGLRLDERPLESNAVVAVVRAGLAPKVSKCRAT